MPVVRWMSCGWTERDFECCRSFERDLNLLTLGRLR